MLPPEEVLANEDTYTRLDDFLFESSPIVIYADTQYMDYLLVTLEDDDGESLWHAPEIGVLISPDQEIDLSNDIYGLPVSGTLPVPDKMIRVWANDLITISHDYSWTIVSDAAQAFNPIWLESLVPPLGSSRDRHMIGFFRVHFSPRDDDIYLTDEEELANFDCFTPSGAFYVEDLRKLAT